jgi:hypothetical protein
VSDISDHLINFQQLPAFNPKDKHKLITNRKFNAVNMDRFKVLLSGTCWQNVCDSTNVDAAFELFWTEFSQLYEVCFPLTTTKLNRNIHRINGYMTPGLLISRTTKNNLHKRSLIDPSPVNVAKFKTYRNLYNSLIRKSKNRHFEENLNANVKNPKRTWELLKEVTVGTKHQKKIDKITVNGEQISDPSLIAEEFNSFFTNIGKTISDSVRPTSVDPIDLMPEYPNLNDLEFTEVGPNHLCEIIKTFETKSSCDLDGISIKLLKHVIFAVSVPLSHIFNLSLASGTFPSKLKTSRTVPIYKAGSPLLCDNYRPISLLSTLSKLLEKIVCRQLVAHLEDNNLIYEHQYGFQHGKSTEHNLIQLTNYLYNALNEKKYALGIFLDLKKALMSALTLF